MAMEAQLWQARHDTPGRGGRLGFLADFHPRREFSTVYGTTAPCFA